MPTLTEWQTFLSVQDSAAATLTGLVFVAVSINLTRILSSVGLPSRAAESLIQFLQVLFICSVALIPHQPETVLGLEILAIALVSWVAQVIAHIRYARSRSGHPVAWLITRIVQTQLASLPFFIGTGYLLLGWPAGLYWLVPGFIFSFVAGVANAWVLLVVIHR